jgi:O-antigen ligase
MLSLPVRQAGLRSSMTNSAAFYLAGLTVLLTASRVVIVAGLMAAFFLLKKKGRILLLIAVLLLLPVLYTRFSSAFNFDALSLIRREEQAVIAWKLFLQHPFTGVGLNNFIPAASDQLLAGPSRFLQPVHNIFLLSLAETGLVGLLGLLCLIGYPIKKIFSFQFSVFNLLPWAVIIFLGLFDHYFLTLPQGYRLLFLVWGLSLSATDINKHLK